MHDSGFPDADKEALGGMAREMRADISFIEIEDRRLKGLPLRGFTLKATWYRIFAPELMSELDRVIYLDSDALVLDALVPLWTMKLRDNLVAAVTNIFQEDWIGRARQLRIRPSRYFNAGVLVMNLDQMRREDSTAKLLAHGRANARSLTLRDQDTLNVVLGESRLDLHPRWNCMNSILRFPVAEEVFGSQAVAEARTDPAIRHFEGPSVNKPWHRDCTRDMRDLYAEYREKTPWPDFELEDRVPEPRLPGRLERLRRLVVKP